MNVHLSGTSRIAMAFAIVMTCLLSWPVVAEGVREVGLFPADTEMTPQSAYDSLKAGNRRFFCNTMLPRRHDLSRDSTANRQQPFAAVLACMDSRTTPELMFDRGIGEIFTLRVAGNIVNGDILGSLEYATNVVGVKLIAVIGHTDCGAVKGAMVDNYTPGHLSDLLVKIEPAVHQVCPSTRECNPADEALVSRVTEANVRWVMRQIPELSRVLKNAIDQGQIRLVGGIYDVRTGCVRFFNDATATGDSGGQSTHCSCR